MEFGVVLPQLSATWDQTLGAARKAEAAGFDSVWLVDHVYGIPPQPPESVTAQSYAAIVAAAPAFPTKGSAM